MHSTQIKVFICYTVLIVLVLVILLSVLYLNISTNLRNRALEEMAATADNVRNSFDARIQELSSCTIRYLYSDQFKQTFYQLNHPLSTDAILAKRQLADIVFSTSGPLLPFSQANFVHTDGRAFFVGNYTAFEKLESEPAQTISWFSEALRLDGKLLLLPPHQDDFSHEKKEVFSIVRAFSRKFGGTTDSIVEVQAPYDELRALLSAQAGTDNVFVFDENGALFNLSQTAANDASALFSKLWCADFYNQLPRVTVYETSLDGLDYVIGHAYSSYIGMHIWVVSDMSSERLSVFEFGLPVFYAFFFVMVAALFAAWYLSYRVSLPIRKLCDKMYGMQVDDLSSTSACFPTARTDLEQIDLAYQEMCQRWQASMQNSLELQASELEAKLLAYQMQMGPHFLYNILTIISIQAERDQTENISYTCSELIRMLRYISGSESGKAATVEDELEHATHYVNLMRIRAPGAVSFQIDVPLPVLICQIPRLMIQPIVENCFKYGTNAEMHWNIRITGELLTDGWMLTITDDGPGFPSAEVMQTPPSQPLGKQSTRIGLRNIAQRLRLAFGDSASLTTSNLPSGGACVTITVHQKGNDL